jgi:hypothetical protein
MQERDVSFPQPSSPGIKIAAVARQLGVSRSWASR